MGGADTIDASTVAADAIKLALNGGAGNDTITGSQGSGSIDGGSETDTINVIGADLPSVTSLPGSGGDDAVNVNLAGVGLANVVFTATQRIGQLDINSGGVATLSSAGGHKVLTTTGLGIAGSGKLDLGSNDLIVDYTGLSQLGTVRQMLANGRNSGAWNGPGIVTSAGNAATLGVGFGEAASLFPGGTFSGQPVDATAVVVKFTFYGDANLDGKVDVTDLGRLATSWQTGGLAWSAGDFTYDSLVDVSDLGLLASNWQAGVGSPLSRPGAGSGLHRTLGDDRIASAVLN
jgi:hypothetical protein